MSKALPAAAAQGRRHLCLCAAWEPGRGTRRFCCLNIGDPQMGFEVSFWDNPTRMRKKDRPPQDEDSSGLEESSVAGAPPKYSVQLHQVGGPLWIFEFGVSKDVSPHLSWAARLLRAGPIGKMTFPEMSQAHAKSSAHGNISWAHRICRGAPYKEGARQVATSTAVWTIPCKHLQLPS